MKRINAYLLFGGNAAEVIEFYKFVFNGKITNLQRFEDVDPEKLKNMPLSAEDMKKVMHATLDIQGQQLMFSDTMKNMEHGLVKGTNVTLCVHPESKEESDRLFAELSAEGNVKMPLHDSFWGAYFGMLTDKYGIHWMVNYSPDSQEAFPGKPE